MVTVKTNSIISQKELENGIWQFLIDHSVPYEKDLWLVKFLQISTKEDLMKRIYSRATGLYKIKDEDKIKKEMQKKVEFLQGLEMAHKNSKNRELRLITLRNKSKWKYNLIMSLRRIVNKLVDRWTKNI